MNGMKNAGMSASGRKPECGALAVTNGGGGISGAAGVAGTTGVALATCGIGTSVSGSGPICEAGIGWTGRHITSDGSACRAGRALAGVARRTRCTIGRFRTGAATVGLGTTTGLGAGFTTRVAARRT